MFIRSERLYLREATLGDADVFFRMDSDPEVMRYVGAAPTTDPEVTRAALGRVIATYTRQPGFGAWCCCLHETQRCVGWVGLKPCSFSVHAPVSGEMAPAAVEHVALGYRLLRDDWGRGYATEMTIEVLQYGFWHIGLDRIIGACQPENVASARVMTKAGLIYAGRSQHGASLVDVYAASKSSWRRPSTAGERLSP